MQKSYTARGHPDRNEEAYPPFIETEPYRPANRKSADENELVAGSCQRSRQDAWPVEIGLRYGASLGGGGLDAVYGVRLVQHEVDLAASSCPGRRPLKLTVPGFTLHWRSGDRYHQGTGRRHPTSVTGLPRFGS
jgi:hypothetical protein